MAVSELVVNRALPAEEQKRNRGRILDLERAISGIPGSVKGDSDQFPLKHSFADGVYVREIFIPKGSVLTGKIHRHSHPNFLMKGEVVVFTEGKGREHYSAPMAMISEPGIKRAIFALEDTIWITVHVTGETDLKKIEDYVITESYDDPILLENKLVYSNCLIRALKEKGRPYKSLLGLKAKAHLLPFKEAVAKLKEEGVSVDGLFATRTDENEWHVSTNGGEPLDGVEPLDSDFVGTWVAAGTTAATIGTQLYLGSKRQKQKAMIPNEVLQAMQRRNQFASTGSYGEFTAGEEVPLGYGDYSITPYEQQGLTSLGQLLSSGMPGQFSMGDEALRDMLETDPSKIEAQFTPFKARTERQIAESNDALKRSAAFGRNLYSTSTIKGLGDIQAKGNEAMASELANLTNEAANRRLQAIPLAYQAGKASEDITQGRLAAAFNYGSLPRTLNDASIKARDAELLRRRQEMLVPLDMEGANMGVSSQFGIPEINTSPYQSLLNMGGQLGGQYLQNEMFKRQFSDYLNPNVVSTSGGTGGGGTSPYGSNWASTGNRLSLWS